MSASGKATQFASLFQMIVMLVIGFIEIILIFRFVLKLLGASAEAEIVSWILVNSSPFIRPFAFAFNSMILPGGFVIEWTTLFAIFAYAVIGYILREAANMVS